MIIPRILIVEDNAITALHLQELLKNEGYTNVERCDYGEQAIEKARNPGSYPHLYLMDIGLKGDINGIQAAKEIQKINPKAKFIFISGEDDNISLAESESIIVFSKPINENKLLGRIGTELSVLQFLGKVFTLKNSIFIKTRKGVERIKVENISVLETKGGVTKIFTKQGKSYSMTITLREFINQWSHNVELNNLPNSLYQVGRNHAINVENIEYYNSEDGICIEGHEGFVPYSRTICSYFDKIFIRIKTRKSD